MMVFDDAVNGCLSKLADALGTPLLVVDLHGRIHVTNRPARELLALGAEATHLEPGASAWHREILGLMARLATEESASEAYLSGARRVIVEGRRLSRGGVPFGALVLLRPGLERDGESPADDPDRLAHAVTTSLQTMLVNLYVVRRWAASQASADHRILTRFEALSTEVHRLNALLEGLLPVEAGLRDELDTVWLAPLLDEVVTALTPAVQDAGVRLTMRISALLPAIRGDARLLREAFLVLLRARLAMLVSGDETEIIAGASSESAFVRIRVVRSKAADRIREAAARASDRALGVADWIVRRHGGTIEAFEAAGTVLVKLPSWTGQLSESRPVGAPNVSSIPTHEL